MLKWAGVLTMVRPLAVGLVKGSVLVSEELERVLGLHRRSPKLASLCNSQEYLLLPFYFSLYNCDYAFISCRTRWYRSSARSCLSV